MGLYQGNNSLAQGPKQYLVLLLLKTEKGNLSWNLLWYVNISVVKLWNLKDNDSTTCGNLLQHSKIGTAWGALFGSNSNKRWGPRCGHYSSDPLGHYWSQVWVLGQVLRPQGDHKWETWTGVSSLWPAWNDLVRGHYFSRTRINAGTKIRLLFKLSNGQLLKSGLGPLARYGTHQETISGRPEQKYLLSEQRLECPAEGPLFKPVCFCKFQIAYPDR